MTTGELIKMYRTRRNLKQRQLAIASGTSFSYMSEIEADKRKPSMNKLEQIAAALDVNPRALLEDAVSPALIRWYVLEDGRVVDAPPDIEAPAALLLTHDGDREASAWVMLDENFDSPHISGGAVALVDEATSPDEGSLVIAESTARPIVRRLGAYVRTPVGWMVVDLAASSRWVYPLSAGWQVKATVVEARVYRPRLHARTD